MRSLRSLRRQGLLETGNRTHLVKVGEMLGKAWHLEGAGLVCSVHLSLGFRSKAESGEFSLAQVPEEEGQKEQIPGKLDGLSQDGSPWAKEARGTCEGSWRGLDPEGDGSFLPQ